jgi:hypothetical protein
MHLKEILLINSSNKHSNQSSLVMHGGLTSSTNSKVNTRTASKAGQENVLPGPTKKATLEIATSSLDKL